MSLTHRALVPFTLALLLALAGTASAKTVLGWLEPVTIETAGITLMAKIDTGADNTSVHAVDIEIVKQADTDRVRFTLIAENGERIQLVRPLKRIARIKLKKGCTLAEGDRAERPVVELDLCIGGQRITAPVNLTDRAHFKYPLLIGRSVLRQGFLVDSSEKHLTEPACATP